MSDVLLPSLLYLNSTPPFNSNGVLWLVSPGVQLPGVGPATTSSILVTDGGGFFLEGASNRVDSGGQAWLSSIPGFVNVTIGPSNINSLAADYAACAAPITFTNGLRQPTQPSVSNGAAQFHYSYLLTDGYMYAVHTNLTITTSSAFATLTDALGNPYLQVVNVSGTRMYSSRYYDGNSSLLSNITGLTFSSSSADQRFYPYGLLSSAPGVYSMNTAPFLDALGIEFNLSPPAPLNGYPLPTPQTFYGPKQNSTRLSFSQGALAESTSAVQPVDALQQQWYHL